MAIGGEAVDPSVFDVYLPSRFRKEAHFDKPPTFGDASGVLSQIACVCAMSNPTGETMSADSGRDRMWMYNWQTIQQSGQYEVLYGGSGGTRSVGVIIPEDGFYAVDFSIYMQVSATETRLVCGIYNMPAEWTPPARNYCLQSELSSRVQAFLNADASLSAVISGTAVSGVMWCAAGTKVFASAGSIDTAKAFSAGNVRFSINKVG